jgi:alpha-galactosidase
MIFANGNEQNKDTKANLSAILLGLNFLKNILVKMNRKDFIQMSGTSIAALIFTKIPGDSIAVINPPDEVWIQSDDQWSSLKSTGTGIWEYRGCRVILDHDSGTLPVLLEAPTLAIQAIKLLWKYNTPDQSIRLGDHWERTYGDVSWQHADFERKSPWYVFVFDGRATQCFGVKTGCHSICYWQLDYSRLQLILDTRSGGEGVRLGSRRLNAADIIIAKSAVQELPYDTARRFCAMMCRNPKLPTAPVYGINDWYFAYGNNSSQLILEHTKLLADLATNTQNRPFSVIDAGWTKKSPLAENDCCWGDDFSQSNDKFGDMAVLASKIKAIGMKPGLWVRPLSAGHTDKSSLLMPPIKGRDDPKYPFLDPTIPENLERIKALIGTYQSWGYQLVKHDYTSFDIFGRWGFEMIDGLTPANWHFHDNSKTNAEIILQLYQTLRDGASNMYLIGCNTMSHLSAGMFELNRIGDDTSGQDWKRTKKMGVNTLGFRIVQHQAFYATDGDCVGITEKIPWIKNKQWMQLLAESGTPLFISAQPAAIGPEQREEIKKSFQKAALEQPLGQPLDWLTNPFPAHWKLNGRIVDFLWD